MNRLRELINAYRLPAFLIGAIAVACVMISVSMIMYYASGSYQLDLSRPEYLSVRAEIESEPKDRKSFDAQGAVDVHVLEQFLEEYRKEAGKVIETDAFSGDVLSDEQLGLGAEPAP